MPYKLDVAGDVRVQGTLYETSTERIKSEIEPIGSQLDNIMQLSGKKFYKNDNYNRREIGFIAEEVSKIYPEFVSDNNDGINYGKMVSVLVEAIKELNNNLDEANNRIKALEGK